MPRFRGPADLGHEVPPEGAGRGAARPHNRGHLAPHRRGPGRGRGRSRRLGEPLYEALEGFRFLPAGRIVAGAGTGRTVTLFNCFVMGTVPDDMGGIFSTCARPR
jgi:ribonucleotide reductase alpha subunit